MNKHDIEELQAFLQGDYISEATSRSLKEVKKHQQEVSKHSNITDKAGFHKLIKKKMKIAGGYENATGASGVTTSKTGTTNLSLTSADFKIDSPAEKLFDRLFDIVKNCNDNRTTQISTSTRKELFDILGLPDNQWDIYPNRCSTRGGDSVGFKTLKLVLFKSVGTDKVFPKVGYRFFHASQNPDIAKTGLRPSLGSTHGYIDEKTGKPTTNRSYNKKSCFFMAIKNDEDLIGNIINKAFTYGEYVYEYKPRKGDIFYEDLFSRPGHSSVMKDAVKMPDVVPVFINSNTNLPVVRIDKNVKVHQQTASIKKIQKEIEDKRRHAKTTAVDKMKELRKPGNDSIKAFEKLKQQIQNADSSKKIMDIIVWCPLFFRTNDQKTMDKLWDILKQHFNDDIQSLKKLLIDEISSYQQKLKKQRELSREIAYETQYKLRKQEAAEQEHILALNKQRLKSMHNYPAFESYIDETIERFDAFMEEFNTGQIGDNEYIMESAQDDKYAKITQDYIKKSGRSYFRYKKGEDTLPPEVEARIFDLAHKIIDFNDKGNFNQYKAYYDAFCKLVHHPNNTCIMGASINNIDDGYINLGILSNRKTAQRCPLKPGMHVYTTSNDPTLTTLDPYHFKGEPNSIRKTRSKNKMPGNDTYYAFPRAYFYVESFGSRYGGNVSKIQYDAKGIPIINNSDKGYGHLYMYTVKAGDQFYFDPELNDTGIIGRAVFMFVKKPVKLIKIY